MPNYMCMYCAHAHFQFPCRVYPTSSECCVHATSNNVANTRTCFKCNQPILDGEPIFNTVEANGQLNRTIVMHQKCLNFNEVQYKPQVNPKPVLTQSEQDELHQQLQQFHQQPVLQPTTEEVNAEDEEHYQTQLQHHKHQQQGYQRHLQQCQQYQQYQHYPQYRQQPQQQQYRQQPQQQQYQQQQHKVPPAQQQKNEKNKCCLQ